MEVPGHYETPGSHAQREDRPQDIACGLGQPPRLQRDLGGRAHFTVRKMGRRLYQQDVCPGRETPRGEQRESALAEGQACLSIAELKNGQHGAERGDLAQQVLLLLTLG